MRNLDTRARSLARVRLAIARTTRRRPGPRRGPDATGGEPMPVEPPRSPTLSGGAAATLDA